MVLNHKGHLTVGLVRSAHFPVDPGIFVYQVPIVVDSQAEGFGKGSILLEDGCFVENVIRLPVSRCPAGINQGRVLPIDCSAKPIGKGVVLKTVYYL